MIYWFPKTTVHFLVRLVQGVSSKPTFKFNAQNLITLTMIEVHQIFLKVNPSRFKPKTNSSSNPGQLSLRNRPTFFVMVGPLGLRPKSDCVKTHCYSQE